MKIIFGKIIDAWTAFLSEGFTPRSRAQRSTILSLFSSGLILVYIFFGINWLFTKGFDLITNKTKVNAHETTQFFNISIKIDAQYQVAVLLLSIVFIIYFALCVKSLITRRFYDMGSSYFVSRSISSLYLILIIIAKLKSILTIYNQNLPDFTVKIPHFILINDTLAYVWTFLILIPILLLPSNTIKSKKPQKKKS